MKVKSLESMLIAYQILNHLVYLNNNTFKDIINAVKLVFSLKKIKMRKN